MVLHQPPKETRRADWITRWRATTTAAPERSARPTRWRVMGAFPKFQALSELKGVNIYFNSSLTGITPSNDYWDNAAAVAHEIVQNVIPPNISCKTLGEYLFWARSCGLESRIDTSKRLYGIHGFYSFIAPRLRLAPNSESTVEWK
jgi:hypothetical protein